MMDTSESGHAGGAPRAPERLFNNGLNKDHFRETQMAMDDAPPCPCDTSHVEEGCYCPSDVFKGAAHLAPAALERRPGSPAMPPRANLEPWVAPPAVPAAPEVPWAARTAPAAPPAPPAPAAPPCPCATSHVEPECFCPEGGASDPFAEADAATGDADAMACDSRCDACPWCGDVCDDPDCAECAVWRRRPRPRARSQAVYTLCEIRRHCTAESCWLVAGRDVFDATPFLSRHPAGTKSIVRVSGGRDCTEDLGFHSGKAQKLWQQHKIGRLVACPCEKSKDDPRGCALS